MRAIVSMMLASAVLLAAAPALADDPARPTVPASPTEWSLAAKRDITAAYTAMFDNHPGVYDPSNPGFVKQLQRARAAGLALADRVQDAPGYRAAFERFGAVMGDGHATAFAVLPDDLLPKQKWPGFVAVWRGDGLYVYASQVEGVAKGARVVSCDGVAIKTLIRRNVFDWYGREEIDGLWWERARRVFIDTGNPFIAVPKVCRFDDQGRRTTTPLTWREGDDAFAKWRVESYNGDKLPIGRSEPRPGLVWIAMPTFQPDTAGVEAYAALTTSLAQSRAQLNAARAIVLDLRQNQGGSSSWSQGLAGALWGDGRVERRLGALFARVEIWYRANDVTAKHVDSLVAQMRREGFPDDARSFEATAASIRAAIEAGQPLALEPAAAAPAAADPRADRASDPAPLTAPVYVIVPGQCASACNDAIDTFTQFEGVKLVGAPSSNDSYYMEVRVEDVPSGLARVVLPTKIWMHRPRGPKDFFRPDIPNRSLDWSTASFADLIEADLNAKAQRAR